MNFDSAGPLWLFATLVLGIVVLPGLDMAYVLASALANGRRGGAFAISGILAGGVVHFMFATLGLGLVLRLQPAAFNAMVIGGATYMAWIGWSLWHGAAPMTASRLSDQRDGWQSFKRGALTSLSNPKAYLFMLSVVPAFVRVSPQEVPLRLAALVTISALTQITVYGSIAWTAGSLQPWLLERPAVQIRVVRLIGMALMLAAVWTALHQWR